jgi:rfaE bifunctional protein nucleotidyltransferase chain/domain
LGTVVSQNELISLRREWKASGKRVVFTSGHFDLLHPGHVRLLEQARSLGDILVVAIESDESVAASAELVSEAGAKSGSMLAISATPAGERGEILAAFAAVDYVVEFSETPPDGFMMLLKPEIVVKGGTAGSDEMEFRNDAEIEAAGSKVVRLPLEPGYSTAGLIERITQIRA